MVLFRGVSAESEEKHRTHSQPTVQSAADTVSKCSTRLKGGTEIVSIWSDKRRLSGNLSRPDLTEAVYQQITEGGAEIRLNNQSKFTCIAHFHKLHFAS